MKFKCIKLNYQKVLKKTNIILINKMAVFKIKYFLCNSLRKSIKLLHFLRILPIKIKKHKNILMYTWKVKQIGNKKESFKNNKRSIVYLFLVRLKV